MTELNLLFDNQIDSIIVDDMLSADQIATFLNILKHHPEWKSIDSIFFDKKSPLQLFSSQYSLVLQDYNEEKYLELCKIYHEIWEGVTKLCGFDPYNILKDYLEKTYHTEIEIAAKNHQRYCPIVARDLSMEILPHADFGPYDGKGWEIEKVVKQVAWNIYLTDPQQGGNTIIYDHIWNENDIIDENSYGIKNINKPIKTQFSVKPGRLVLFNSRNFHEVLESSAERIAIGGLLGLTNTGKIIAWS